jgi:hypothetical protein
MSAELGNNFRNNQPMSALSIDYRMGYRYATELLHEASVSKSDALRCGVAKWNQVTATNLIESAQKRKDRGINISYQDGVIARACLELEG